MRCPNCGYEIPPADMPMTEREHQVLAALRELRRSPQSPVRTRVIADFLSYDETTVRRSLTRLKELHILSLPLGRCSGWVEQHPVTLELRRVA